MEPTTTELSNEEYLRRANEWMEEKGIKSKCVCGRQEWQLSRPVYSPFIDADGLLDQSGAGYMFVPWFCNNCGFTILFNGALMGLAPLPVNDISDTGAPA